jgi:hypothetical protein
MKIVKQITIKVSRLGKLGGLGMLGLLFVSNVYAGSLSVRMTQPPAQTNRNDFPVQFVALDINGNPVSVVCYKKGPSDGGFIQFGSTINLPSGGGSGACPVSSIVNEDGTYTFYVNANANGESQNSGNVTVSVNRSSRPGTPVNYSKDKPSSCEYRIKFKSADDGGKTDRVEIYRTDDPKHFELTSGNRVAVIDMGSNENREHVESVPDCNKNYYYRVRAADSYGNYSDSTGDTYTETVIVTVTPGGSTSTQGQTGGSSGQTESQGAVAVQEGKSQVGAEPTSVSDENGSILGEESEASEESKSEGFNLIDWILSIIRSILNFFKNLFS